MVKIGEETGQLSFMLENWPCFTSGKLVYGFVTNQGHSACSDFCCRNRRNDCRITLSTNVQPDTEMGN